MRKSDSSFKRVAVNLSPRHFASPELLDGIKMCLREAQVRPGTLQLGITARVAMANPDQTASILSQLRRLEVTTAIDDFGTGTISLSALRHFAADVPKISRTLVASMQADRASQDVVDLIVMLAGKLKCEVVAQGIEKPTQLERLRALGCNFAQGCFLSSPLAPEAVEQFLHQEARSDGVSTTGIV